MKRIDVAVVGGGAAGLAAALRLRQHGVSDLFVFERSSTLGGILSQCLHAGFGLHYYGQELTGPEYAGRLVGEVRRQGIEVETGATVRSMSAGRTLVVDSAAYGRQTIEARAVILATGCRERTRENLEIAGTRPAGVYTAGQAQTLVNLMGLTIGSRVIIQGSGDIGLIMARRLVIEGYDVVAVFERLPYLSGSIRNKVQCLDAFGIPIRFNTEITRILGRTTVEGVAFRGAWEARSGSLGSVEGVRPGGGDLAGAAARDDEQLLACDTVLIASGLIPESMLAKGAGACLQSSGGPKVSSKFETDATGIFSCGNALHIHELADDASREGERVADRVAEYLAHPRLFRADASDEPPYAPRKQSTRYDAAFFERLDGRAICTICPKGCVEDHGQAGCKTARTISKSERRGFSQLFTAAAWSKNGHGRERLAIRSARKIVVGDFRRLKEHIDAQTFSGLTEIVVPMDGNRIERLLVANG